MSGTVDVDGRDRESTLALDVYFPNLRSLAGRDAQLEGTVSIDGIATDQPIKGTLDISGVGYKMEYQFTFDDDEGESHRFVGAKEISVLTAIADFCRVSGSSQGSKGDHTGDWLLSMDIKDGLVKALLSARPA